MNADRPHPPALAGLLPRFIRLPAATFAMGTPERDLSDLARRYGGTRESYREESPQHQVRLAAFAIAATPVTNALYALYAAASGARADRGEHPLVNVSWHEALAFCAWLGAAAGAPARLPSEAEWEYAARAADGRAFPWGNTFGPGRANTSEAGLAASSPVGAYPAGASPSGALDMAGNVWEWTSSLDRGYPYRPEDGREDLAAGGRRILRGGCYANPHGFARCACRFRLQPQLRNEFIGFRLALSIETS
jgi:formylglycine-generating enzyme required for sulfatase activity